MCRRKIKLNELRMVVCLEFSSWTVVWLSVCWVCSEINFRSLHSSFTAMSCWKIHRKMLHNISCHFLLINIFISFPSIFILLNCTHRFRKERGKKKSESFESWNQRKKQCRQFTSFLKLWGGEKKKMNENLRLLLLSSFSLLSLFHPILRLSGYKFSIHFGCCLNSGR